MFNNLTRNTLFIMQSLLFALVFMLSSALSASADTETTPAPQQLMEDTSKEMIKAFMENTEAIRKDPEVAHTLITDNLVPKINFPLMS
ncbi:MAG: hypothetical protein OQL19_09610, partial [Gammaproteobacteria bacterium]|nr:hypothetical protein [Gammaproteobacteria bacterium]